MAFTQLPGTNFHDLNLDWLLKEMKNCLAEWASTKEEWEVLKGSNEAFTSFMTSQWDDFRTYVENYLANLPLTEEVSAKINAMVEDGTLLELITHDDGEGSALSDVAAQWLATHITQETGYVIDDTLTVQGAAADAKATGDAISSLKNQTTENADYVNVTPSMNDAYVGVTCVYESANVIKLYGTSTSARRVLFLNGQNAVKTSTQSLVATIGRGNYDVSIGISGYLQTNEISVQYTYSTFASAVTMVSMAVPNKHVEITQPAMIGLTFSSGIDFGTEESPTYVEFHMTQNVPIGHIPPVDTESEIETSKIDMAYAIAAMLKKRGCCILDSGIYYVSEIDMPKGSTLKGCGKSTIIRLLQSVSVGTCVKIKELNTVKDVCISGGYSAPTLSAQGTRTGILFSANYDGQEGTTQDESDKCIMNNVFVENFTDSGIKCHNTSISFRKGLYATNIMVSACYCGINIDYYSEFNKFVNALTSQCVIGCVNNGGNNVFTSCTFHGSSIAFKVDGTQPNSAHGTINSCTFCHSGSNNGSAITMENVTNGFVISNCQIWYNSVNLGNCEGILFVGCEFGRNTPISINGGKLVMFNGCEFMFDTTYPPSITIANNTKVKFNACYGSESGNDIHS